MKNWLLVCGKQNAAWIYLGYVASCSKAIFFNTDQFCYLTRGCCCVLGFCFVTCSRVFLTVDICVQGFDYENLYFTVFHVTHMIILFLLFYLCALVFLCTFLSSPVSNTHIFPVLWICDRHQSMDCKYMIAPKLSDSHRRIDGPSLWFWIFNTAWKVWVIHFNMGGGGGGITLIFPKLIHATFVLKLPKLHSWLHLLLWFFIYIF